jgi:hypothetical protein
MDRSLSSVPIRVGPALPAMDHLAQFRLALFPESVISLLLTSGRSPKHGGGYGMSCMMLETLGSQAADFLDTSSTCVSLTP